MQDDRWYYVYILASRSKVLYIGITSRIEARLWKHRNDAEGFASWYRCHRLVLLERYTRPSTAIAREKQLKAWRREKKISLIERSNPFWDDLSAGWGQTLPSLRDLLSSNSPNLLVDKPSHPGIVS